MKLLVFHVSDIHVSSERFPDNPILERVPQMLAAVRSLFLKPDDVGAVLLLVAGDIAYAGLKAEYELATPFFKGIQTGLSGIFPSAQYRAIFLPGNHDCNFKKDDQARQKLIEDPNMDSLDDGSIIEGATSIQTDFFDFCGSFAGDGTTPKGLERLYSEHKLEFSGKKVIIRAINSAWLSRIQESRMLMLPVKYLASRFASGQTADMALTTFHHPYNWFEPNNAQLFRKLVEETSDIIVTGHEHTSNTFTKTGSAGEQNDYIEGGVLQENADPMTSSFNVILVDLPATSQILYHFEWNGELYESANEVVPRAFVRNKNRLKNEFKLNPEFEELLNDADTAYSHPQKDRVGLDDIFLYPDCLELDEKHSKSMSRVVSNRELITHILKKQKVIISGAEKAGKTAISRSLFKDLRRNGKIPLLLSGREIKATTIRKLSKHLDNEFDAQYGPRLKTHYWQLPNDSRAVILDDYQRLPETRNARDNLVRELLQRFEVVILIGGPELRFQELVGYERESTLLWEFNHLEMMAFGHRLRAEFIKKWYRIGRGGLVEDTEMVERTIALEKTITGILGHDLLPSYPIYLLLLLQQLESVNQLDVAAASYGRLYGAVLTAYLAKSGTSSDLETKINFLTELAYHLYSNKYDHLSGDDAAKWHTAYCDRHLEHLDYTRLRDELVNAQVLLYRYDQLSFRYKAGFYYFVASYMADNLNKAEIRDEVKRLCSQLYREAAANIVVFLCHLSKDPLILDEILSMANSLFAEHAETDILKDAAFTSAMLPSATKPVLELSDPEANRLRSLEHQDSIAKATEQDDDVYAYRIEREGQNDPEPESLMVNINTALKTIQIAGQILRNFGGRLEGGSKLKLADACYSLILRMMKWIYSGFEANETVLIEAAKVSICERHTKLDQIAAEEYANAMVFGLLKLATLGLIKQVSNSIGLEKLSPVFAEVLKSKTSIGRRLIDLSIRLDHFAAFPIDSTLQLEKEIRHSVIVVDVLRHLVFNRFYYFSAPYKVKQRVCEQLGIKVAPALLDRDPKKNI